MSYCVFHHRWSYNPNLSPIPGTKCRSECPLKSNMILCVTAGSRAVLSILRALFLTPLGVQSSQFGEKSLESRVRYGFLCTAVLKAGLTPC